jgi:hypothetical protein
VPPATVKTVEDLIYWQYAKIIAESAGVGKKEWGFVTSKFKLLKQGLISWNELREFIIEKQVNECIYCGAKSSLTLEHLLPRHFHGPDNEKNVVWVCKNCNSKKGAKRLYEYFVFKGGLDEAKYRVPRIAEGKYLKFAHEAIAAHRMLEMRIDEIVAKVCPRCDLKPLCIKEDNEGKLSTLCIDGILTLCFSGK